MNKTPTLHPQIQEAVQKLITQGKKKGFIIQKDIDQAFSSVDIRKDASGLLEEEELFDLLRREGIKVKIKSPLWEWVESIVIAFILAMFIRAFFIQAFKIPSGSMRMTLIEGDRLMVNKLPYGPKIPLTNKRLPGFSHWKRGDIIVFAFPDDPKRDFIKRLVGLENETIEIREGDIYINGQLEEDSRIKDIYYYNRGQYGAASVETKIPKGYVFVLGDNSGSSHDSRFWGFVPVENIIGRAEFIYWPPNRIRLLK